MKKVNAVIFDFDGVIISSKCTEYESWRRVFKVFNCHLSIRQWIKIIDNPEGIFDPASILIKECKYGKKLNTEMIKDMRFNLYEALNYELKTLPGITKLIKECYEMRIPLGMASNGTRNKVITYMDRLNLIKYFTVIKGRDDVGTRKPKPDVYLATIKDLKVLPNEVIVFEDSPPGITAAKAAGTFCIAVPNLITKYLDVSEADIICKSLRKFNMEEFIKGE